MHRAVSTLLLFASSLVCLQDAWADGGAWLRVDSNLGEGFVSVDSAVVGRPGAVQAVPPGAHLVRVAPEDPGSWSITPIDTVVVVMSGDTLSLRLDFPHYYRIESLPFGADVYQGTGEARNRLGATPLTHVSPEVVDEPFVIEKAGFHTAEWVPGDGIWNRSVVVLERSPRVAEHLAGQEVPWSPPPSRRWKWVDYGALGIAVAAAVVSVQYKFRADDLYEKYEETGDPAMRARIERLDRRATVALGAMQLGVGVFAVRLALR